LCDVRFGSIKPSNTTAPAKDSKEEDKTMMNTKLNMDEIIMVNGGTGPLGSCDPVGGTGPLGFPPRTVLVRV
jgi:hypothetical protein